MNACTASITRRHHLSPSYNSAVTEANNHCSSACCCSTKTKTASPLRKKSRGKNQNCEIFQNAIRFPTAVSVPRSLSHNHGPCYCCLSIFSLLSCISQPLLRFVSWSRLPRCVSSLYCAFPIVFRSPLLFASLSLKHGCIY